MQDCDDLVAKNDVDAPPDTSLPRTRGRDGPPSFKHLKVCNGEDTFIGPREVDRLRLLKPCPEYIHPVRILDQRIHPTTHIVQFLVEYLPLPKFPEYKIPASEWRNYIDVGESAIQDWHATNLPIAQPVIPVGFIPRTNKSLLRSLANEKTIEFSILVARKLFSFLKDHEIDNQAPGSTAENRPNND